MSQLALSSLRSVNLSLDRWNPALSRLTRLEGLRHPLDLWR